MIIITHVKGNIENSNKSMALNKLQFETGIGWDNEIILKTKMKKGTDDISMHKTGNLCP